jgi:YD repeat-containing protein
MTALVACSMPPALRVSSPWTGHYNVDRSYGTNGLNQLTTAGTTALGYDGRGNLTSSGATTYSYTSENRLATGKGEPQVALQRATRPTSL